MVVLFVIIWSILTLFRYISELNILSFRYGDAVSILGVVVYSVAEQGKHVEVWDGRSPSVGAIMSLTEGRLVQTNGFWNVATQRFKTFKNPPLTNKNTTNYIHSDFFYIFIWRNMGDRRIGILRGLVSTWKWEGFRPLKTQPHGYTPLLEVITLR